LQNKYINKWPMPALSMLILTLHAI
jgi:hypothetical protein